MKTYKLLTISAVAVALLAMTATAEAGFVPSWIKGIAGSWANNQISDTEFVNAIQFLVDENVIQVDPRIIEIEVIKEAQAQTMPTDNGVLWESIGDLQNAVYSLQQEYELTVQHNYSQDIWDRIDQIQSKLNNVADTAHDNKIKVDCMESGLCNNPVDGIPIPDYEAMYNELSDRHFALAERVLELERAQ